MEISQRKHFEVDKHEKVRKEAHNGPSLSKKKIGFLSPKSFKTKSGLPLKPIFLSFFLFIVGLFFFYIGMALFLSKKYSDSTPSLLLGILCIIPGSYYSFSILQILRGVSGYSFEQLDIS
ncbi:unnamed protein product [Cryptosporidium hominis]|uniref:Transmembrane protein 230 n=1 Tax=Cryptosporidium hominis TaxID=237895 RepID=A0A0S4TBZ6_CRYHO|nr:hypothetical protein [Cryptosporidium hominis TU502]OLQ16388.1 hypothetical protein ChTU502y2012_378g0025 [Cryptosporidium hominis]PPA62337.1 Eukaryotic protein of unknown function (DUF872) family protein [Cryptosporidium hominis]PPS93241.1 Uncharacterized protein GY17_00003758 [Cryptosporidium hominis]CUV04793.1 unnamed protein product [Cryptosporidium hominis]|eukprot:PPS93241.1 Uncharacterized protein GY17_00003758 [Cryptosporidium hominis]